MDLQLLATLKEKRGSTTNFSEVQTYFLDHFGDHPAFIELGEPTTDEFLEQVLAEVVGQLFHMTVTVNDARLVRLPDHKFVHGGFMVQGKVGTLIYFEDVCKGLISVAWSLSPPETKFMRFSGRPLQPGTRPSRN